MKTRLFCTSLLMALLALSTYADRQPRWMSPEEGFIDPDSKAEVTSVSRDSDSGSYRVEIAMPKLNKSIEEVLVIGTTPDKPESPQLRFIPDYEIVNDFDSGRSGVVIYLDKKRNFVLLINYDDGSQSYFPEPVGAISP